MRKQSALQGTALGGIAPKGHRHKAWALQRQVEVLPHHPKSRRDAGRYGLQRCMPMPLGLLEICTSGSLIVRVEP
jgi:hypothetical protein